MDVDMDASPRYFDPEDQTIRERFRRYGKRPSASSLSPHQGSSPSKFSETRLFYDGQSIHSPTNAALILDNIKQEVESMDGHEIPEADVGFDSVRSSLKACKREDESLSDSGYNTFAEFACLLDPAIQGHIPIPELILQFEKCCRTFSKSIRDDSTSRHRVLEDKLMRQKAQQLLDEAASWSLLWYLYGKGNNL